MDSVDTDSHGTDNHSSDAPDSQFWQTQLKTQVQHVKTFIETNAKEHPVLFFIGAFAVGYLASKPRMLGMLGRSALGLASASGIGLKINPLKTILKSFDGSDSPSNGEREAGAHSQHSSKKDADSNSKPSTHH